MNRWKHAAIVCSLIAAISNSSPVFASLNRGMLNTETAAIRVAKNFPADMATNISTDSPLTVEFGGAVNQSFYKSVNLNLFQGSTPIKGELYYNPSAHQIMFKSKKALKAGTTYTAQLSFFDGLGRTSEKVWSFQTMGGGNHAKLMPTNMAKTTNPANISKGNLSISNANMGSGVMKPGTPLEVSFSEPLDISSLKSAPVRLFANNRPVGVDYKLSRDLKTLTIKPRNTLKVGNRYAIAISKSLAGSSGATLKKQTLIPFKVSNVNPTDNVSVADNEIAEAPASPKSASREQFNNPFANQNKFAQTQRTQRPQRPQRTQVAMRPMANTAPLAEVIGLSPRNGSRVKNITQPVTIGFNEEIRPETLNEFTFRLEDDFGPVPAKIHYFKGSKQATLTPIGELDPNKSYRVVVTQGVTDLRDRPIKTGITSKFMVVAPAASPAIPSNAFASCPNNVMVARRQNPVKEANELENFNTRVQRNNSRSMLAQQNNMPVRRVSRVSNRRYIQRQPEVRANRQLLKPFKVAAVYPGVDSDNVSRRSKIAINFSEPADLRSVNNINISVFGKLQRVDGKVIYDRRKNRAIFEPTRPLDADTQYKVLVSSKIKSKNGEALGKGFSWQFITSKNLRRRYIPRRTAEADAAFYIPLVDGRIRHTSKRSMRNDNNFLAQKTSQAFNFVNPKHWAFKAVKRITNRGLLDNYPFSSNKGVTRYEFANTVNMALNNLKSMQSSPIKAKLRVADLVQLEELVMEFRKELRAYSVNTGWFERFLSNQGVDLRKLRRHVMKMNG